MAASIPNTAPMWCTLPPSRSRYQFILLGEQRHTCVNNLPRVAPSGGTAGNRTRGLSITNPTPYRYTTKPHTCRESEALREIGAVVLMHPTNFCGTRVSRPGHHYHCCENIETEPEGSSHLHHSCVICLISLYTHTRRPRPSQAST